MSWWRFLKYNNAVPIIISLVLLSFGTTLAASPEIREGVADSLYATDTKVISIDNTYIANKDLTNYTPRVIIRSVSEDQDFYYVQYDFTTIDIKDSVWQDVTKEETIRVQKPALEGKDLGLYVTRELAQRVDSELTRLRETQTFERAQVSQKVIATEYSGLIGKFIDDSTETIPGYTPVVQEVVPVYSDTPSPASSDTPATPEVGTPPASGSGDQQPPVIQILGANPARLELRSSYIDLGVVITDNSNVEYGYKVYTDGVLVTEPTIDTSVAGVHTIVYKTEDASGNRAEATRTVIVGNPQPESAPPQATSTPPQEASTTPVQ